MPDNDDLERLREQTSHGDRIDETPATASDEPDPFVVTIQEELAAIDDGDRSKTISVWDGNLAAFIHALEAHPNHQQAVGEALAAELETDVDEVDRSNILRLALRVGFRNAAPDEFDALRTAVREHATKTL